MDAHILSADKTLTDQQATAQAAKTKAESEADLAKKKAAVGHLVDKAKAEADAFVKMSKL